MTTKRSPVNSPYFGNNNQVSKVAFRERKLYKDFALTGLDERIQPPVFDVWYDKKGYGKIDISSNPIILDKANLKKLSSKDTEFFAVNFVADAFNDFREFIFVSANQSKISLNSSTFLAIEPRNAYIDFQSVYDDYLSIVYNDFNTFFLNKKNRQNKIKNFDDFMAVFEEYISSNAKRLPISQTGFAISRFCPPHCSGLIIELADASHADDRKKFDDYINDINFLYYAQAADKYGFRIDKNAPWRLIADVKSEKMQEYMARYPLEPEFYPPPGNEPQLPDPRIIFQDYLNKSFEKQINEDLVKNGTLTQIIPGMGTVAGRLGAKFVFEDAPDLAAPPDIGEPRSTPRALINNSTSYREKIYVSYGLDEGPTPGDDLRTLNQRADVPPDSRNQLIYFKSTKRSMGPGNWGIRLSAGGSSTDPDGFPVRYIWNLDRGPLPGYKTSRADFPDDDEDFVLYPEGGPKNTYVISLRVQYQNGLVSPPCFATIEICGFPWGPASVNPSNLQDPQISEADKNWYNQWIPNKASSTADWYMGASEEARTEENIHFLRRFNSDGDSLKMIDPKRYDRFDTEIDLRRGGMGNKIPFYDNKDNPPDMYGWLTQFRDIPIHPDYREKLVRDGHGPAPGPNEIYALRLETKWGPYGGRRWQKEFNDWVFNNFQGDILKVGRDINPADTFGWSQISVYGYTGNGRRVLIDSPETKGLDFTTFIPTRDQLVVQGTRGVGGGGWDQQSQGIEFKAGFDPDSFGNVWVTEARKSDGRHFFFVGLNITNQNLLQSKLGDLVLSPTLKSIRPARDNPFSVLVQILDDDDARDSLGEPTPATRPAGASVLAGVAAAAATTATTLVAGAAAGAAAAAVAAGGSDPEWKRMARFEASQAGRNDPLINALIDPDGAGGCFFPWTPANNIGADSFSDSGLNISPKINNSNHPDYREWCRFDVKKITKRPGPVETDKNPVYWLNKNWQAGKFQYLMDRFKQVKPPHPQSSTDRIIIEHRRTERIDRGRERLGGFTYGAHGFIDFACPDIESVITTPIGYNVGSVGTLQEIFTLATGIGNNEKVIVDFDFPKITSTGLSDEEFQALRKDYLKKLEEYPDLFDVWLSKRILHNEYIDEKARWEQLERLSFDNLFLMYYNRSQINDTDILRRNMITFYNSFAIFNPISSEKVIKCDLNSTKSKLTTRREVSERDVLESFKEDYWFQLYFSIRVIESGINISKAEHNRIMSIIRNLFNSDPNYAKQKATVLIASKTKGILK